MADDVTDVIGVLRTHLEEIHSVLHSARVREEAVDLADALRHGRHSVKPSSLVNRLLTAESHLQGYLSVTLEDDDISQE